MINQSIYQAAQISNGNYIKSNTETQITYVKEEKNDEKKKLFTEITTPTGI